ncbi:hypothetical protein NIIDNTM18_42290 [Mycolicibacterium litorale]|uniref:Terminase small subunit n=1 Tax=Mycolicibacterium litorale TaxID=758802 RepID=A0A6S6PB47_9MYCO|nr:hypothetical protein [Mycolicibacterium litorale]BCI54951.1 hypothetical protein NIIDNTM18_42290 [Mycolicibacterium litorale]
MAKYVTLNEAMDAKDELGEAELRYKLLAEVFESEPKLRSQLNPAIVAAKAEINQLRALATEGDDETSDDDSGDVVPFDASRFRKSS